MKKSSVIAVAAAVLIVVLLFAAYNLFRFPAAFRSLTAQDAGDSSLNMRTDYEYEVQDLYAQRGENVIYGVAYIPQNAGEKMPAVIFSHGFGGTHQVGDGYARALAQKGYMVYCFDFCGGGLGSSSGGSPLEMSVFTEKADLEAVMEMVSSLDYVDSENLFLMGTSQGGAVSAITGADHRDEVRGMILLYPAFVLADRANELFQSVEEIPDTYYFLWMNVGRIMICGTIDPETGGKEE